MKILIFTDVSLVGVYSYIKKYQWKFWNIYEMEIDKNSWNVRNNSKNDRNNNNIYWNCFKKNW